MKDLRVLVLSRNSIRSIPDNISQDLEFVDLSENAISHLPGAFLKLKLGTVDLRNNCLSELYTFASADQVLLDGNTIYLATFV